MWLPVILFFVCAITRSWTEGVSSDEMLELTESCCSHGEAAAMALKSQSQCSEVPAPDDIEPKLMKSCLQAVKSCCSTQMKQKEECNAGIKLAPSKRCGVPKSDVGKTCCEECSFGRWTGESQGKDACGSPAVEGVSATTALRKNAYHQCCLEAAEKPETTTVSTTETTTKKTIKERCKKDSCEHICDDEEGRITCRCRDGYRLQSNKKSCKDINECAEAVDDLCSMEGTVCHNTPGSFKCVPIKKRETVANCPPGFKKNIANQVCDDINECQLPRPPCPKYLCENTIGGYKCAGKPGKVTDTPPKNLTQPSDGPKTDICPPGFRSGVDDECVDIDECAEVADDCQRLSQHCINTHGSFFCQDHGSRRCAPGFKFNTATGICEDIDECEQSTEVCKRSELCVNQPGAYDCKSKISTLPKLATKTCQEGTRLKPGGTICEDIDECLEGTHLCDQFQNCINTFGGHECRCKNGFELDSKTSSCVDVDECALKLDNCAQSGLHCLNLLGSFSCTRQPPTTSTQRATTTTVAPIYEYEYYDSDEENTTEVSKPATATKPTTTTSTSTTKPSTSRKPNKPFTSKPLTTSTEKIVHFTPRRPEHTTSKPEFPTEVTLIAPRDPITLEKEKDENGGVGLNTSDIPKDKWTNVIIKERPEDSGFDPNELHCLNGYERNNNGQCIDINECEANRHVCGHLEHCTNKPGGYVCECIAGFFRDSSGWCAVLPPSSTTSSIPRTTASTTSTTTEVITRPSDHETNQPRRPAHHTCEMGFTYDPNSHRCVDVDECVTNKNSCASNEECVNIEGGFRCDCGKRCRTDKDRPTYVIPPRDPVGSNVITIGAQYGQRGPKYVRPSLTRLSHSGAVVTSCPWGYKLTPEKRCIDIDECARNTSECGNGQRCENFFGGYSCQCPGGHRLLAQDTCEDVDECSYGNPCAYSARCINTIGSYRCECGEGFRNAPSNDKLCVDVDECAENPNLCHQGCSNSWGSYRCYCRRGFRLSNDNRTCVDVDECSEWSSVRLRGRLCGGDCINEPGSYRCSCPSGYRLSEDKRSCIDIDECETGEASCSRAADPGTVCQNTRGGYHCHRIDCPPGYTLEAKHRCTRVQRSCRLSDWKCLEQPSSYSYNFITFVSNIYLPSGSVDLFTMHGPAWSDASVTFELRLVEVRASPGVTPANLACFDMRPMGSVCVVSLLCSLNGPQVAELELTMAVRQREQLAGTAVARLIIIVSQYDY